MKYFLYCRKSTDREDRQILGTDAQKRLLLEHAGRQGLTVASVYVENQTAYKVGRCSPRCSSAPSVGRLTESSPTGFWCRSPKSS